MPQPLLSEIKSTPLPNENDPALKLIDEMMLNYWQTYPELYRAVNAKKAKAMVAATETNNPTADANTTKAKLNQSANDDFVARRRKKLKFVKIRSPMTLTSYVDVNYAL